MGDKVSDYKRARRKAMKSLIVNGSVYPGELEALALAEGKRLERERIEGIIAQMEKEYTAKMIGIPHAPDFMAALSELKKAIAGE